MSPSEIKTVILRHIFQCGQLMPKSWIAKNSEDSDFIKATEIILAWLDSKNAERYLSSVGKDGEAAMKFMTRLKTVEEIKKFVKICNDIPEDVPVRRGAYVVPGNSIMGIFSLDLMEEVEVTIPEKYSDRFEYFINISEEDK